MATTLQDNAASSWKSNDFPCEWTVDKSWLHRPWCLCFYRAGHTPVFLCLRCFFLVLPPIHRKVLVAKYRLYHKSYHLNGWKGRDASPEFLCTGHRGLEVWTFKQESQRLASDLLLRQKWLSHFTMKKRVLLRFLVWFKDSFAIFQVFF